MSKSSKRLVDITEGRVKVRPEREDVIDEILRKEEEELAREAKRLRLEEIIARKRKRLRELDWESEPSPKGGSEEPTISVALARELAKLPEEERQKVIATYALLRSAEKGASPGIAMLPLLIGFARTNPGSTQGEMVEFAKAMSNQFRTGVEAAKDLMPKPSSSEDPTRFLEAVKDLIQESVKKPLEDVLRRLQPQPSVFEQILLDEKLFNRAKELGIFGKPEGGGGKSEIDLEIEKLRGERELQIKKLELEMQKALLEHQAQERRTETLLSAILPFGTLFARPVEDRLREAGRSTSTRFRKPQSNRISIMCSCGYRGSVTFEGEPPEKLKCPKCGKELVVGPVGEQAGEA